MVVLAVSAMALGIVDAGGGWRCLAVCVRGKEEREHIFIRSQIFTGAPLSSNQSTVKSTPALTQLAARFTGRGGSDNAWARVGCTPRRIYATRGGHGGEGHGKAQKQAAAKAKARRRRRPVVASSFFAPSATATRPRMDCDRDGMHHAARPGRRASYPLPLSLIRQDKSRL